MPLDQAVIDQFLADMQAVTDKLKAQITAEIAKPQPKARYDAQGRLLEAPGRNFACWFAGFEDEDAESFTWQGYSGQHTQLMYGMLFVSRQAAKAEAVRLRCLQRLRGMGLRPYWDYSAGVLVAVRPPSPFAITMMGDLTEAERAAFNYREPGHAE